MAKLTRNHLKELVKECLFEILLDASDGGEQLQESRSSRLTERSKRSSSSPKKKKKASNLHPSLNNLNYSKPTSAPQIDTSALTSDPIMAAIFEDTAATTLKEQAAAERGRPIAGGDAATLMASNNDPTELFSGASQNWAALAFSDPLKK